MYEQINTQALAFSKSFTDAAFKANSLAVEGFERITNLQLKALENRVAATVEFWSEAAEVRDLDGFKTIWPKSVNLVKETTETLYANGQEVFNVMLKTSEALGQLARSNIERATTSFGRTESRITREKSRSAWSPASCP